MNDTLLGEILQALELIVIERLPDSRFRTLTPVPAWLVAVFDSAPAGSACTLSDALPFLDHFLPLADTAWHAYASETVDSGPYTATVAGEELLVRAVALTQQGRSLLLLERLTGQADTRPLLQTARNQKLEHERLVSHITKVHAPAADIDRGMVELLAAAESAPLTPAQQAAVDRLHQASVRLQEALAGLPTPPTNRRKGRR